MPAQIDDQTGASVAEPTSQPTIACMLIDSEVVLRNDTGFYTTDTFEGSAATAILTSGVCYETPFSSGQIVATELNFSRNAVETRTVTYSNNQYLTSMELTSMTSSTTAPTDTTSPTGSSVSSAAASSTPSHTTGKGYSSGTVAGAAVGSAIGAALLAALITFFFLRRRRNDRPVSGDRGSTADLVVFGKGSPQTTPDGAASLPAGMQWLKYLPQPADDSTVAMRIKTLYNQIELHVENFYRDTEVRGSDMSEDAQEALLDLDSGLLASSLPATILHSPAKGSVIKHTLAHLVLSNIATEPPSKNSFLPAEYTTGLQNLGKDQENLVHKPALPQCQSLYRVLTAYLNPDPSSNQTYLKQRENKINRAAKTFTTAFGAWSNGRTGDPMARQQNLIDIMHSAAETGVFVFSQPDAFEYRWDGETQQGQSHQRIVTLPAFVKVVDGRGFRLETPAVMVNRMVEDI